jgi:8-oxo-dGTP diphosphatase
MSNVTPYVVGFCFSTDKRKLALIRKKRPKWQAGLLNGFGGHIEDGESPMTAMTREFQEETGVTTTSSDWRMFARLHGEYFSLCCFACFNDEFFKQVKTTTDEEVCQVHPYFLQDKLDVVSNVPWLVGMCLDSDFSRIILDCHYDPMDPRLEAYGKIEEVLTKNAVETPLDIAKIIHEGAWDLT